MALVLPLALYICLIIGVAGFITFSNSPIENDFSLSKFDSGLSASTNFSLKAPNDRTFVVINIEIRVINTRDLFKFIEKELKMFMDTSPVVDILTFGKGCQNFRTFIVSS